MFPTLIICGSDSGNQLRVARNTEFESGSIRSSQIRVIRMNKNRIWFGFGAILTMSWRTWQERFLYTGYLITEIVSYDGSSQLTVYPGPLVDDYSIRQRIALSTMR